MVSDFDKSAAVAGLLDQRYTVRYSFSVTAEILDLETGSRLRGETSDLSLRGCFVRRDRRVETGAAMNSANLLGVGCPNRQLTPPIGLTTPKISRVSAVEWTG